MFWPNFNHGGSRLLWRAERATSPSELNDLARRAVSKKDYRLLVNVAGNENTPPWAIDIIAEYVDKPWPKQWLRDNSCEEVINGELMRVDARTYFKLIRGIIAKHPNTAPGGPADRLRQRILRN